MLWCQGVQDIELSSHELKSALKCNVWSQCTPVPDRQTDIMATARRFVLMNAPRLRIELKLLSWLSVSEVKKLLFMRVAQNNDCSFIAAVDYSRRELYVSVLCCCQGPSTVHRRPIHWWRCRNTTSTRVWWTGRHAQRSSSFASVRRARRRLGVASACHQQHRVSHLSTGWAKKWNTQHFVYYEPRIAYWRQKKMSKNLS